MAASIANGGEGAPAPAPAPDPAPAAAAPAPAAAPATPADPAPAPSAAGDGNPPPGDGSGAPAAAPVPGAGGAQGDTGGQPAAPAATAPGTYELRYPEGAVAWPQAARDNFEKQARDAGLSNEDAQGLLEQAEANRQSIVRAQIAEWAAQTVADPVYGGANLEATKVQCQAAIDKIRPAGHPDREAFQALLDTDGIGNHPLVVRFLADIGRVAGEAKPSQGPSPSTPARKSTAEVLFGGTTPGK